MLSGRTSLRRLPTIRRNLVAAFLAVSIIPLLGVTLGTGARTITRLDAQRRQLLNEATDGLRDRIDLQIDNAIGRLRLLNAQADLMLMLEMSNQGMQDLGRARLKTIETTLENALTGDDGLYAGIFVTDRSGRIVVSGMPKGGMDDSSLLDFIPSDMANRETALVDRPSSLPGGTMRVLPVTMAVRSLNGWVGSTTILFDLDAFLDVLGTASEDPDTGVMIVGTDGAVIRNTRKSDGSERSVLEWAAAQPDDSAVRQGVAGTGEERMEAARAVSAGTGWDIIASMPYAAFHREAGALLMLDAIAILMSILAISTASILMSKSLSRPLKQLVAAFEEASGGKLDVRVRFGGNREMAAIRDGFNQMAESLEELAKGVHDAGREVHAASATLMSVSQQSLAESDEVCAKTFMLVEGAHRQKRETEESGRRMAAVTDRIGSVRSKVDHIGRLGSAMMERTLASAGRSTRLKLDSKKDREHARTSAETMERLQGELTQIRRISTTLGALASNTNLLALNASIEAARVGMAGMGFEVLAGEIRSLSDQAAVESREIEQIVRRIGAHAMDTAVATNALNVRIEGRHEAIEESELEMRMLSQEIRDMNRDLEEIMAELAGVEQERDSVDASIRRIRGVSETTSLNAAEMGDRMNALRTGMHDTTFKAEDMERLAAHLMNRIGIFRKSAGEDLGPLEKAV